MGAEFTSRIHMLLTTSAEERPMLGLCLALQGGGPEELFMRRRRRPFGGTIA
jgi:hypothetical protein